MLRRRRKRAPTRRKSSPVRRLVLLISGWFFIFLGILGLFLPVLQGVLFLAIGSVLLSAVSPRARLMRLRAGQRWPKARQAIDGAQDWLRRRFGKNRKKS